MPVALSKVSARPCAARAPPSPGLGEVDELVLAQPFVADSQPAGAHEASGGIGRESPLARSAFGEEATLHHSEGALGDRVVGRLGQREPRPEPVVPADVVEARRDPDHRLAGPDVDQGADDDLLLAGPRPPAFVDPLGPAVHPFDHGHGPDGTGFDQRQSGPHRRVDDEVVLGGRVVVGVAEVSGVDEAVETRHAVDCRRCRRSGESVTATSELASTSRPSASSVAATGSRSGCGLPGLPAEAGDVLHAGQHSPGRRLVELHPDLGVGPESEPGEQVVLYLFDLQARSCAPGGRGRRRRCRCRPPRPRPRRGRHPRPAGPARRTGTGRRAPRSWSARGRPRARTARRGSARPRWVLSRR